MDFEDFYIAKIGDKTFILEECKDFPKGLSKREHLLGNEGMLFNFNESGHRSFHMKECLIPLDIIFIKNNKIEKIYHDCNPCQLNECEKFEHESSDTVIELMGGTCKKNNITEGLIYRLL
jgi:uncharacterized membrane protein (UPF0127 family)